MAPIQRIDLTGQPALSERELKRRWAQFHDEIRIRTGTRFQQIVGRMLGENTVRYKLARLVGRPLLKAYRSLKGHQPAPKIEAPDVTVAPPTYFPTNYRPGLRPTEPLTSNYVEVADVAIGACDESAPATQIVSALNELIASSDATWLFLVDASVGHADRELTLRQLHRAASDADVVFGDEAGVNPNAPILKSADVGPHSLLSYNVVGRPALLRISALREIGGFSDEAGWAFEHDAYLKLQERSALFRHVAVVLAGGRTPRSLSSDLDGDTERVVRSALARRGWNGSAVRTATPGVIDWRPATPAPQPSIDIVIPTRDRLELVLQCIDALEALTTYTNYDIIILDNDSVEPATLEFFEKTTYRVIPCPGPFNYAKIVNRGVSHSQADFVVTLNNDTILITPDWLERMVELAMLDDVGVVGGCLLDQHGHYEHEGIVISPYPQHLRSDSNYPHADQYIAATRDMAAVTGAVQMVRREFWESLGGMDEQLKVTMNDVDLCLRAQVEGRHVVFSPYVRLYHHVSSSRGSLDPLDDRNRFIRRWDIFGTFQDPYFPESLLLLGEQMYYRYRS